MARRVIFHAAASVRLDPSQFPRDEQGEVIFCNVEGVTWGSKELLVTVSDRMKQDQDERCGECDQSIQVFRIPPQDM